MASESNLNNWSGARKSALLLLSLGEEEATEVLRHLDDKSLESVILEMAQIQSVSKEEKERILSEFRSTMEASGKIPSSGTEAAKTLLEKTIGKEKAEVILKKLGKIETQNDFDFLDQVEPQVLFQMLSNESHQVIAVTLSNLDPKKAAEVLKVFPKVDQTQIAFRLATTSKTHPEAIQNIAKILKKRYEERDKSEYSEAGGAQVLANILNFMDKGIEEHILSELDTGSPDLALQVREQLYTFEDLEKLDQREMRLLIQRLGNDNSLSLALRGAPDTLKALVLSNLSNNRAQDIRDAWDQKPRVTLREINEARSQILALARRLEDAGQIVLKKEKEEYIE